MAAPRSSSPRGSRVVGESGRARADKAVPEQVDDPERPRRVVKYALQRRSVLENLYSGRVFNGLDICDADPYLLRAARFHGEVRPDACPVCRLAGDDVPLVHVTYVYGDQLGHVSGSAVESERLPEMAHRYGEFRVYVVEVCQSCHWNHLVTSYVLGDGVPRKAPPRPRDLLD